MQTRDCVCCQTRPELGGLQVSRQPEASQHWPGCVQQGTQGAETRGLACSSACLKAASRACSSARIWADLASASAALRCRSCWASVALDCAGEGPAQHRLESAAAQLKASETWLTRAGYSAGPRLSSLEAHLLVCQGPRQQLWRV